MKNVSSCLISNGNYVSISIENRVDVVSSLDIQSLKKELYSSKNNQLCIL